MRWQEGDHTAFDELMPLVYHQLSLMARKRMRGERASHSFSTGDLVNEAYIKLFAHQGKQCVDRTRFFVLAARIMRHILINHANHKNTVKGGAGFIKVEMDLQDLGKLNYEQLSDLDEAIARLDKRNHLAAKMVELRFFCGFSIQEVAENLKCSPATVKRKLLLARSWLGRDLSKSAF